LLKNEVPVVLVSTKELVFKIFEKQVVRRTIKK